MQMRVETFESPSKKFEKREEPPIDLEVRVDGEQGFLFRNLKALSVKSPQLACRICEPVDSSHVESIRSRDGSITTRLILGMSSFSLHSPEAPHEAARKAFKTLAIPAHQPVLLLGLGTGYELAALLRCRSDCAPVYAYERDPWLMRMTLTLHDFARDILTERVHFVLSTDLLGLATKGCPPLFLWPHPVLGQIYRDEARFFDIESTPERANHSAPWVMLVSGGLFVEDVADAFRRHGFRTWRWSPMAVSREESMEQLKQLKPRFIFSINYVKDLPELCESLGIPLVIWEIDPTIEYLQPGSATFRLTHIYTYRKSRRRLFSAAGFPEVEYLPLAANPARRRPVELTGEGQSRYGCEISFVGDSMVMQARRLMEKWRGMNSGKGAEDGRGGIATVAAHTCANDEAKGLQLAQDSEGRWIDLTACRAEAAASRWRIRVIQELSRQPHLLKVWGDECWKEAVADSLQYLGPAGHFEELNRIYCGSKINLDIARLYQRDIVTMRVFDIMACGGFVLAQQSEDLGDLFDLQSEVASYRSLRELKARVQHFLADEDERKSIAAAGRRRILMEHTFDHRIRRILSDLGITNDG